MEIIHINQNDKWDRIVKSFPNYDVYYLSGYVKAFSLHGDGIPILIHYEHDNCRAICVLMLRDIASDVRFKNHLISGQYLDAITPYGYGGFLFLGNIDYSDLAEEFQQLLNKMDVISVFYRFHPILANGLPLPDVLETVPMGKTIAIDLTSPQVIWDNIISKNRNMIRKAEKNGVSIFHGKGMDLLDTFREIYNGTMENDNADSYYYFGEDFYNSIDSDLTDNYEIFYAVHDARIIAMSIMIYANGYMNYHLSGSKIEYRHLAPSNLLLYKAAIWGYENGMRTLHLGGGIGSGEDNLYKFKAAFNRKSDYRFAIGKTIVDHEKYNFLLGLRNFSIEQEKNISFFPKYRANI